jgi:hypothetical protein
MILSLMIAGLPLARLTWKTRLPSPRTYGAVGDAQLRYISGSAASGKGILPAAPSLDIVVATLFAPDIDMGTQFLKAFASEMLRGDSATFP